MNYQLIRRLDKYEMRKLLMALAPLGDKFTLNFPSKGYDADVLSCENNVATLNPWLIGEKLVEFDTMAVKIREYQLSSDVIDKIVELESQHFAWSWDRNLPEDLIIYRKGSELPLFESYSLDKLCFAVLSQEELLPFKIALGINSVQSSDLKQFLLRTDLELSYPRILAVAEMYLNKN